MKGDFTRNTFQRDKHYSSVRMQQGRVQLDADWNEQLDIDAHSSRITHGDVIGPCGVPMKGGGFEIGLTPGGADMFISPGRIYVDGILCELGVDSLPISFPRNNAAQLPDLMADGRPFGVDQWVEISAAGLAPQRLKIKQVRAKTRTLVFTKNVRNALRSAKNPHLRRITTYLTQADYPEPDHPMRPNLLPGPNAEGLYLAYLDVWEQHVTALQDDEIREVALGVSGPDTTTRTKVISQIKLTKVGEGLGPKIDCSRFGSGWTPKGAKSTGLLAARAESSDEEDGPCIVPPEAGYHRLENQLYRVEIHEKGGVDDATFKWSRENGSVVVSWQKQDSVNLRKLTVSSTGRDAVLGIAADDWVEISDDMRELHGKPGAMAQVEKVDELVITLKAGTISDPENTGATDVKREDFPLHPRIRRWESEGAETVSIPGENDGWVQLEDGVEIHFQTGGVYQTGDSWLIPARTITGEVQWPEDDLTGDPLFEPRQVIDHHYCPLALLRFNAATKKWNVLSDCRKLFPPLTELIRLFTVSGDGQEALPGAVLPRPLQVGVNNGQWPVAGARVRFQVVDGSGLLQATTTDACDAVSDGATTVVVGTDAEGIAACCWQIDAATSSQRVETTLLDIDGKPMSGLTAIRFNAGISSASEVAYDPSDCSNLKKATTVQEAIDILCQVQQGGGCAVTVGEEGQFGRLDEAIMALLEQGQHDMCICLLPGDHKFSGMDLADVAEENDLRIRIVGCGQGSRLHLEKPFRVSGARAFVLRDVAIEPLFPVELEDGVLSVRQCNDVEIRSCHVAGVVEAGALLSITTADRVWLTDNVFEAATMNSLRQEGKIFMEAGIDFLAEPFMLPDNGVFSAREFRQVSREVSKRLADMNPDERREILGAIQAVLRNEQIRRLLSAGEMFAFQKLSLALRADKVIAATVFDVLLDLRQAAIKARPGVAVILSAGTRGDVPDDLTIAITDEDDANSVTGNQIAGIFSLYGPPMTLDEEIEILSGSTLKLLRAQLQEEQVRLRGLLGTLLLQGNHLVRLTISAQTIEEIKKLMGDSNSKGALFNLFSRLQCSDNVFEGGRSVLLGQDVALASNVFSLSATPAPQRIATRPPPRGTAAIVIADAATYVGNHGARPTSILVDSSRLSEQVANMHLGIG